MNGSTPIATNGSVASGPIVAIDPDAIPRELRDLPQWVTWSLVHRARSSKPTKLPLNAKTGRAASTTDSDTWSSFEAALSAHRAGKGDGIGFVFAPSDPYTGIDLDGCYDPVTDTMGDWAREIITRFDTYTELSPSGRGVHLIIEARLPGKGRRKGSIEMYSEGRFFTMTGARFEATPAIVAERSDLLHRVHDELFAGTDAGEVSLNAEGPHVGTEDDDDVVGKAASAKNGAAFSRLWRGDWTGYPSQSEADLALCSTLTYWTNGDAVRVDRLFRRSGLMRTKWDEHRGEQTYGDMTIAKARPGTRSKTKHAQNPVSPVPANSFPSTDAGNAEWFAQLYGDRLRYDHTRKRWLVWEGHRWTPDRDGKMYRFAKNAVRQRFHAAGDIENLDQRRKAADFAVRSESRQKLEACLALSQNEPPIADDGGDWNAEPFLLGVANGVLDLRSGELRPGQPRDRITMNVPLEYDPEATCPRWEQFVHEVFGGDNELIGFIQRAVGYSLTGSVQEQILFLLYGTGANGKSVFLGTLRHLAGDYALNIPFTVLELQQRGTQTNDLAAMASRRLVTSSETNESTWLNEARIKALTGGDPITARFLYSESFTFDPVAKFWLAVNHLPRVRDDSLGFWRKVRVVPFNQRFLGSAADQELSLKLRAELPGILAWAVQGALSWQQMGLAPPDAVMMATEAYREESDELASFVSECCVVGEGLRVEPGVLFGEYQRWAQEQGIQERHRLRSRTFSGRIAQRFGKSAPSNGKRYYSGVGLRTPQ